MSPRLLNWQLSLLTGSPHCNIVLEKSTSDHVKNSWLKLLSGFPLLLGWSKMPYKGQRSTAWSTAHPHPQSQLMCSVAHAQSFSHSCRCSVPSRCTLFANAVPFPLFTQVTHVHLVISNQGTISWIKPPSTLPYPTPKALELVTSIFMNFGVF